MKNQFRTFVLGNGEWAVVNQSTLTIDAHSARFPAERFNDELRNHGVDADPIYCTSESVYSGLHTGTLSEVQSSVERDADNVRNQ